MSSARDRGSRQDTVAALVEAAAAFVGERPPDVIPGRDIAARAGVNYGLIHQYFGGKAALLREGLNHLNRTFLSSEHARQVLDDFCAGRVDSFSAPADRHYFRALAFTALAGRLDELEASAGVIPQVVERIIEIRGEDSTEVRIDVALGLSLLLGWALCEESLIDRLAASSVSRADFDAELSRALTQVLFDTADHS
ncbi:TetR/AcrR family transcriptional regulator [Saccharopolyspora shandongensis]|uniref:TetR/AcrR family transcriptional regulator n=1 Tax=Saccharopolyspora shandongensis TaxID=418495 RepID=UPI0033E974BD